MVALGGVSRASFYRFDEAGTTKVDRDMDLRDAIQRIALKWPSYDRPRITGRTVAPRVESGAEPSEAAHAGGQAR